MIQIIAGTDRPQSRTLAVTKLVHKIFQEQGSSAELLDLTQMSAAEFHGGKYIEGASGGLKDAVDKCTRADGIVMVVPEYNGSYPGILKLFIDYWKYPETFESRPICFIGLGTRWGGLRPVEHLQQVMGYRNAFCFPGRVFLTNIHAGLKDGALTDPLHLDLLKAQAKDFVKYIQALKSQGLDANTKLSQRK